MEQGICIIVIYVLGSLLNVSLHCVQVEVGMPAYVSRRAKFDLSVLATDDAGKTGNDLLPCLQP